MKTRTRNLLTVATVAALVLPALATLDGKNGYTSTRLFGASDVQTSTTYPAGFAGVEWADLNELELWAPIGQGQREGIAAAANGDLFVLVRGRDNNSGDVPEYTGMVRYDGSGFEQLTQDRMSSGWFASRTGAELRAVMVSPSSTGPLTAGHPVLVRHTIDEVAGTRVYAAEVISVDPASGAESFIWSFDAEASQARVAIDGTGGGTDGVVYVGPMQDGRIAALTWNGSTYVKSYVPGTFTAGIALAVSGDGDLYTFDSDESWSYATKDTKEVYKVDPATGSASVHASMPGSTFGFDWDVDASGGLWMGLRRANRKSLRYVAEVIAGQTINAGDRISESDADAWSIAAGPAGEMYVLENPFTATNGEVWKLEPGTGDGGGGGGGGNGGGKGKPKK